jgi:hypothetical protein
VWEGRYHGAGSKAALRIGLGLMGSILEGWTTSRNGWEMFDGNGEGA